MAKAPYSHAPRREPPDREKDFPRYDDVKHIDSAAIDYPDTPPEDYTAEYLDHPAN